MSKVYRDKNGIVHLAQHTDTRIRTTVCESPSGSHTFQMLYVPQELLDCDEPPTCVACVSYGAKP